MSIGSVALASPSHKGENLCGQETVVIDVQFIPEFGWRLHSSVVSRQHRRGPKCVTCSLVTFKCHSTVIQDIF